MNETSNKAESATGAARAGAGLAPGCPAGAQPQPAIPDGARLLRSLRVLVVDDESQMRDLVATWLAGDGHYVTTAGSGAAALTQFKPGQFDVVITDQAMPAMTGEQLAAAIYEKVPSLPVILMTGFVYTMPATGELPPQISAIVCKPITQTALREVLATVVAQ